MPATEEEVKPVSSTNEIEKANLSEKAEPTNPEFQADTVASKSAPDVGPE